MKLVEVDFQIPTPWPGEKHPKFSRVLKAGRLIDDEGNVHDIELELDMKNRLVKAREHNSKVTNLYPFESISRMRVEQ